MADRALPVVKFLPRPKELVYGAECLALTPGLPLRLTAAAAPLAALVAGEWPVAEAAPTVVPHGLPGEFGFTLGAGGASLAAAPGGAEGYRLAITGEGLRATANSYAGLVYAWQTLKQLLRQSPAALPALQLADYPDLAWRAYHLDLKGTRRTRERLYAILPLLAECKLNALLVEYEDYLRLDRHPDLALPEALSKAEWADWIAAAGRYGLQIIPLVQTLGHWQYVLNQPAYAHLRERADNTAEGCSTHPGTWELARDFLDEIIELHPHAPFIHIGMDETFLIGTCPRCREARGTRSRTDFYVDYFNRVVAHVRGKGLTPMAWGDMIISDLSDAVVARLDPGVVLVDWGYGTTGPDTPSLHYQGGRVSRRWLRRPNGDATQVPAIPFRPGTRCYEELDDATRAYLAPHIKRPDTPRQFYSHPGTSLLRERGLRVFGVSGVRVSSHGGALPDFMLGQLNTLDWAATLKQHGGEGIIASSWARGHSFAGENAHPEMDWYGIATLGESAWGPLGTHELQDFDARFAATFFGLPDGHFGDLLYLVDRTSPRADHVFTNYLEHIAAELPPMMAAATRNRDVLELFGALVDVLRLRMRGQFALLEIEYFYACWQGVPPEFRARIGADIAKLLADMAAQRAPLTALCARTLTARDAAEMVANQLDFVRDGVTLFRDRVFGPPT